MSRANLPYREEYRLSEQNKGAKCCIGPFVRAIIQVVYRLQLIVISTHGGGIRLKVCAVRNLINNYSQYLPPLV